MAKTEPRAEAETPDDAPKAPHTIEERLADLERKHAEAHPNGFQETTASDMASAGRT